MQTLSTGDRMPLPMDAIRRAWRPCRMLRPMAGRAPPPRHDNRHAPKLASVQVGGYTITGIAKGAGMIAPNMATMLAVIATDAAAPRDLLERALAAATENSFNRIVVDGDMSTNDTVLVLANGASGVAVADEAAFTAALADVCAQLAQAIVRDGEGATSSSPPRDRGGGRSGGRCHRPLDRDLGAGQNGVLWRRSELGGILCAAGYAVSISIRAGWRCGAGRVRRPGDPARGGRPAAGLRRTGGHRAHADAGMGRAAGPGRGRGSTWVWTCDLSHDYVTINGHYRISTMVYTHLQHQSCCMMSKKPSIFVAHSSVDMEDARMCAIFLKSAVTMFCCCT